MPTDKYEDRELDGRYHLLRLLDAGNFGAVYEARDNKLGRIVAVKILFEKDETAFRKEAKLAVQFEHPNVVKVFDYGADRQLNVGYIVMEFLKGRRLDQLITAYRGRLPEGLIIRFVDQIGGALQLAHERQLIHRDLKPHNVMTVDEGTPQERFVLLDLGLASQMNSTSTLRNQTLDGALSPRYASPEQFGQGAVDFRSDIYSFGTILYELVTGETPFVREQLLSLMMAICSEPPPSFRDTAPDREVPPEVEDIVLHCLAKQPLSRPDSVRIVRSRIMAAYGADTALPIVRRQAAHDADTDHAGLTISNTIPRHTGTILPPAGEIKPEDSLQGPVSGSVSKPPSSRSRARRVKPRPWRALVIPILLFLPISLAAIFLIRPPEPRKESGSPPPPREGRLLVSDNIEIESGTTRPMQLYIELPADVPPGQSLSVAGTDLPETLRLQVPESLPAEKTFEIALIAAPVLESQSGQFQLVVTAGDWKLSRPVRYQMTAPQAWPLPKGFEPVAGSQLMRSATDPRIFHRQIVRRTAAGNLVPFLLIDPPTDSPLSVKSRAPFYMMETKVWNALFNEFWASLAAQDPQLTESDIWKQGATAGNAALPADLHPQLPVVRVTAFQAHQFAVWLGGAQSCHLPSIDQWNLASGLLHWQTLSVEEQQQYPEGPFRGRWQPGVTEVAVGQRQLGPRSVGESPDDVTLTGCRDMAGNVQELTETMMNGARVGDLTQQSAGAALRVVLRGRSYLSEGPLTWDEIQELSEIPDAVGYQETDPTIGFRVVLETTN